MNICLATAEFLGTLGGIGTYTHNLATILLTGGHRVTVLTSDVRPDDFQVGYTVVSLADNAQRERTRLQRTWPSYAPSVYRNISAGLAMRGWLDVNADRYAFDVVEVPEFGGYGALLAGLELPPLAVTCHSSYGQMVHYNGLRNPSSNLRVLVDMESHLMALAEAIGAYSPMNAGELTDVLGREVPFIPAPWLFDTHAAETDEPQARSPDAASCKGVVVGRLQDWKGALEMVAAAEECRKRAVPVCIRWIGRDTSSSPDGGSMADYLAAHYPEAWGKEFVWSGSLSRKETKRAQVDADFAIVPSRWDTLNYTALESMSLNTPVIVTARAGASYLVRDGYNGFTVPCRDPVALADAIERMALDASARRSMGAAAFRTMRDEFEPETLLSRRIPWYESAIERRENRKRLPFLSYGAEMVAYLLKTQQNRSQSPKSRVLLRRIKHRIRFG